MDGRTQPVLVIFDLDLSRSTYDHLCEKLNKLGVEHAHKLGIRATVKTPDNLMLMEIWPSRDCEQAFKNNILPLMEAMQVQVKYRIYPIRSTCKSDQDIIPPQSRWMRYN